MLYSCFCNPTTPDFSYFLSIITLSIISIIFNFRPIQEHRHHHSILIHLDAIHSPKHQINIQFLYRLCILHNLHKIHSPELRQQILSLHLPLPFRHQQLPALQQPVPCHQINFNQRFLINMPIPTPQHTFYLIPLTALPHLPVSGWCPPPLPRKRHIAFPADNLAGKRVYLRVLGKPCDVMFLQIPFPSLCFQLHTFPNPGLYYRFMIILNIILLDFPLILHTFLCQEIRSVAFLQKRVPFVLFIFQHTANGRGLPFCPAIPIYHTFSHKNPLNIISCLPPEELHKNPLHNLRLLFIHNQLSVFIRIITKEPLGTHLMLPDLKPLADTSCAVL